ncbi:MAG: 4Fe-4S dicluster domain-containing protein [Candidatus Lokiarchaeota archaeon]
MSTINFKFRNEVLSHNASLSYCYQCSTCSGGCPVALLTEGSYNPRKIIEEAILGFQDHLIEQQTPNVWLCSTCQKCVELCPQKVELTEIFILIKNRCFDKSKCPESFSTQGTAILENGIAIPYSNAILSRRKKFKLPEIKTAPIDEIKEILKVTGFEKNIMKGGNGHE